MTGDEWQKILTEQLSENLPFKYMKHMKYETEITVFHNSLDLNINTDAKGTTK